MASRRAEKQRCSQLDSSQTKFKVADAFELTKSVSVDEDPIHLWDASHKTPVEGTPQLNEMITFGPLYADSLCTQWSDDAIASTRNPLDADSLCTKWPNDATVASQTVPILNPLSTDSLCTKWPVDAPVDSQSSTLPDLASQYTVVSAWPDDLVERVHAVVNHSTCVRPTAPEFQFELSCDAADHNAKALERYGFNLGAAIEANSSSPLGYGSEFRPVHILAPIFERHPNWNRLKTLLTVGSKWPLEQLSNEIRKSDLAEALTFGNHKGATSKPELLRQLIEKDVIHGFGLVIPLSTVNYIPGALLAPMNIMKQNTIDEFGNIIPKDRLTHDQSYKWSSGTSVNSWVQFSSLLPCRFGACIRRIANYFSTRKICLQRRP